MSKHTPGAWRIDREHDQVHIVAGRAAVARVMHGRADGDANALLIAQAPSLLRTLESIAALAALGLPDDPDQAAADFAAIAAQARAAIAAATKETQ